MKDQILKMECESIQHNKQQLSVRFVIPVTAKPGTPPTTAKTIVQAVFTDKADANEFVPGDAYTITIKKS